MTRKLPDSDGNLRIKARVLPWVKGVNVETEADGVEKGKWTQINFQFIELEATWQLIEMIQRKWERFSIFLGRGQPTAWTWTDNQNSLDTLFTSEEYRMVMDKARGGGWWLHTEPLATCYRLQQAQRYQQWILTETGNAGLPAEHCRRCILAGLWQGAPKQSLNKVQDIKRNQMKILRDFRKGSLSPWAVHIDRELQSQRI